MLLFGKNAQRLYVSRNIIETDVASTVLEFNNGTQGIRKIYENADLCSSNRIRTQNHLVC